MVAVPIEPEPLGEVRRARVGRRHRQQQWRGPRRRFHPGTVSQRDYELQERSRKHTVRSLRQERATQRRSERVDGIGPGRTPARLLNAIPLWHGRRRMIQIVNALAKQPFVIAECKRQNTCAETWRKITINDLIDADKNGRGVRTSQRRAGGRVEMGPEPVKRARKVSQNIGIAVKTYAGRDLWRNERLDLVRASPGHKQRGIPNEYVYTVCPAHIRARISVLTKNHAGQFARVNFCVHLPPLGGRFLGQETSTVVALWAADAARSNAPPPAAQPKRKRAPVWGLATGVLNHHLILPMLPDVQPGQIVAQLTTYQRGGWSPGELATCLHEVATRRGYATWAPAHSPFGLLKTLLDRIDPVAAVHLAPPTPLPVVQPCGHPDCDGHGWRENTDHRAIPCPDCPPLIRASTWGTPIDPDENGDPPF